MAKDRRGIVSELGEGENLGFAKVDFDDRGYVSDWLGLPAGNTQNVKEWNPVEEHSQVECIMDDECVQGYISNVSWSEQHRPPAWASKNNKGIEYPDGTQVFYDWEKGTLTVNGGKIKGINVNAPDAEIKLSCKKLNINGEVNIKGDTSIDGQTMVTGDVIAGSDTPQQTKVLTHTHTTNVGPSGPPIPQ